MARRATLAPRPRPPRPIALTLLRHRKLPVDPRHRAALDDSGHPAEMGEPEIGQFLSSLACDLHVSASAQNQALNAVLFLYREVIERKIGLIQGVVRAKRPRRLPVILTSASRGTRSSSGRARAIRIATRCCPGTARSARQKAPAEGTRRPQKASLGTLLRLESPCDRVASGGAWRRPPRYATKVQANLPCHRRYENS